MMGRDGFIRYSVSSLRNHWTGSCCWTLINRFLHGATPHHCSILAPPHYCCTADHTQMGGAKEKRGDWYLVLMMVAGRRLEL